MKNISILGCGWLGAPLAISLLEAGYSVKGSTTTESKLATLEASQIEAYLIDIAEFEEYDAFLNTDILIIAITSKDIDAFESLIAQIEDVVNTEGNFHKFHFCIPKCECCRYRRNENKRSAIGRN